MNSYMPLTVIAVTDCGLCSICPITKQYYAIIVGCGGCVVERQTIG